MFFNIQDILTLLILHSVYSVSIKLRISVFRSYKKKIKIKKIKKITLSYIKKPKRLYIESVYDHSLTMLGQYDPMHKNQLQQQERGSTQRLCPTEPGAISSNLI